MSVNHSVCFCNRVPLMPNDRNMQTQHIATLLFWAQYCWVQHVANVWPPFCDMLGVVGLSLKIVRFDATTPCMSQHVATGCMAKRTQHDASNNVVICCVGMLRSFGRGFNQSECSFLDKHFTIKVLSNHYRKTGCMK